MGYREERRRGRKGDEGGWGDVLACRMKRLARKL
jgi:hypothetical protein